MSQHLTSRRRIATLTAGAVVAATAALAAPLTTTTASAAEPLQAAPDRPDHATALAEAVGSSHLRTRPSGVPEAGRYSFLLQLDTRSTGRVFNARRGLGTRKAGAAARAQLTKVEARQDAVVADLPARTPVLYRTHAALAGVAVTTNVKNYDELAAIPGVEKVYPIAPKSPDNSYAVPLQGGDAAWEAHSETGAGVTVAVIDTGIDFTHANFGGAGTTAAYETEHALADSGTLAGSSFPTTKVVGGYDLVGDDYDADGAGAALVPQPDPNPLDCEGHGSHVAGTVAGLGVKANGDTYDGTYDTSTPFETLRIGPGMAPEASLMAFRVFGCEGSSDVVTEAIDRALDPNDDGSIDDAVDVINMSLGSDFGAPDDADAIAADAAAAAGVTMAISSGNSYDLYDVGGSPGTAPRAITVAASVDAQSVVDGLDVTGDVSGSDQYAALRSVAYDWASDDDLAGEIVIPTTNTTGCDPFSGADADAIDGKVALLTWTDDDLECGSVTRSGNVAEAGGIGFVFDSNLESFSAGITGSEDIPGVLVNNSGGDAIRAMIGDGETVTVDGTEANAVTQEFPDDDNKLSDFSSRGIRGAGNVKPDVAAVGATVFSTAVGTGAEGVTESGTSMAAPMVAGLAALVVAQHPDWTAEQVKADIMNTAGQDVTTDGVGGGDTYAPNRVGAGRIQAAQALDNEVLAYVINDPGAVSASFGPIEVVDPTTLSKTITVENTGSTATTYDAAYDAITTVPGVDYSVSPAEVTVAGGESKNLTITMTIADPTELTKTFDVTHGSGGDSWVDPPFETLADASGNLVLTPQSAGPPSLRVPVYAAPRPASELTQDPSLDLTDGDGTLTLSGSDVDQGAGSESITSLVAGLELQATSPVAPDCSPSVPENCVATSTDAGADIEHVGVASDSVFYATPSDGQAYFGISTHAPHSTPAGPVEFDVYLDVDRDGVPDLALFTTRLADTDTLVAALYDFELGDVVDWAPLDNRFGDVDAAIFDSQVVLMPVWLDTLLGYGVDSESPRVDYAVESYSSSSSAPIDALGWGADGSVDGSLSVDLYQPGVVVYADGADGGAAGINTPAGPLLVDEAGAELFVKRFPDTYAADQGQGILMLHLHNEAANQAQVVELAAETPTVSLVADPSTVMRGAETTLTVTVADPEDLGTPTGEVTVVDSTTDKTVGTVDLSEGSATLGFTSGTVGVHQLVATYAGNAAYAEASSSATPVTVTAASRGVTLAASPTTVVRGADVALTVSVAHGAGDPVPTGDVTVKDGSGDTVASGALGADGTAALSITPTKPATLTLTATYAGDANTKPGASAPVTVTVTKAKPRVKLSAPRKATVKKRFRATVRVPAVNGIAASGKVVLKSGGKTVASGKLRHGKATLRVKPRKAGKLKLKAVYRGDATFRAGSSKSVTVKVKPRKRKR